MTNTAYLPTFFNEFFGEVTPIDFFFSPRGERRYPATSCRQDASGVNLYEDERMLYLEAALPGIKPEEIQVTFDRGGVSIEGKASSEKKKIKHHIQSSKSFSYWVPFPSGKVEEKTTPEAVMENGILTLSFPKIQERGPIKIEVRGSS